jgi:hypothetical protein
MLKDTVFYVLKIPAHYYPIQLCSTCHRTIQFSFRSWQSLRRSRIFFFSHAPRDHNRIYKSPPLAQSWDSRTQSITSEPISPRSILIVSCHPGLDLPDWLGLTIKIMYIFLISAQRLTYLLWFNEVVQWKFCMHLFSPSVHIWNLLIWSS